MHHQDRQIAEQLDGIVPVGDRVHGVVSGLFEAQSLGGLEAVDVIGGGGQSAGAQGALVQPLEGGGLGPLQVGVAGHDGVGVLLGPLHQHLLQVQNLVDDDGDLLLHIPGPGGVQALARVADALGEQGLDVHVDVLVVHRELHLVGLDVGQNGLQAVYNGLHLVLLNDALLAQHLGVGDGAGDVLLVQPGVKLDGGVKIIH